MACRSRLHAGGAVWTVAAALAVVLSLLLAADALSDGRLYVPYAAGGVADAPVGTPTPRPVPTSTPTATRPPDALDVFFSLDRVHEVRLDVGDDGYRALLEAPREYVSGTIAVDGEELAAVGVRLKGHAGSFVPLDGDYPPVSGDGNGRPGKSAFVLRFDEYVAGQRFRGLSKLTVNNLVQDPSSVHEFLGYALFRAGRVPASRVGYADVHLNGRPMGLYALVESPDDAAFLGRWFGGGTGNLYEGEYGADLRQGAVDAYEQDRGADKTRADLRALVAELDAIDGPAETLSVLEARFDLDAYLAFAATELYLGHFDGYAWAANNYRIYHDPSDDRWTFLPWGIDQVFREDLGPFAGVMREVGPSWGPEEAPGRVHALCIAAPDCRRRLYEAYDALLERVRDTDLVAMAGDAFALVGEPTLEEAREFGDPLLAVEAQEDVYRFIGRRAGQLEAWLPCLAGETIDGDGDGWDACTADCDDGHPAVHPGSPERCNFQDDDCNGVIDDPDECPRCVPTDAPDGSTVGLCFDRLPWAEARRLCMAEGGDLASVHDRETADYLAQVFAERLRVGSSWIGLNDRATEGTFEWTDGSPLDFVHWAPGAPGEEGEEADCVAARPYGWRPLPCGEPMPAICRLSGGE